MRTSTEFVNAVTLFYAVVRCLTASQFFWSKRSQRIWLLMPQCPQLGFQGTAIQSSLSSLLSDWMIERLWKAWSHKTRIHQFVSYPSVELGKTIFGRVLTVLIIPIQCQDLCIHLSENRLFKSHPFTVTEETPLLPKLLVFNRFERKKHCTMYQLSCIWRCPAELI